MINGVKKLEFMFKTLVAHIEAINPIYRAPGPEKQRKISERSNTMLQNTYFGGCSSPSKTEQQISPIYQEIFWV